MDGKEKRVPETVGKANPLIEGDEVVRTPRHYHFKTCRLKKQPRTVCNIQGELLLPAIRTIRAVVMSPMAGIQNNRVDQFRPLDLAWPEDRLNDLHQIHAGDTQLAAHFDYRV